MYDYLKGLITDKRKTDKGTFVTVEVSGVGYLLEVAERDFISAPVCDCEISTKFYVSLILINNQKTIFFKGLMGTWGSHQEVRQG